MRISDWSSDVCSSDLLTDTTQSNYCDSGALSRGTTRRPKLHGMHPKNGGPYSNPIKAYCWFMGWATLLGRFMILASNWLRGVFWFVRYCCPVMERAPKIC